VPEKIDKENMLGVLDRFWKQCQEARQLGTDIKISPPIHAIIIGGMGGSAMPGDVLRSYLGTSLLLYSCRDYVLPAWADKQTLVFCVSYSGNTEETV